LSSGNALNCAEVTTRPGGRRDSRALIGWWRSPSLLDHPGAAPEAQLELAAWVCLEPPAGGLADPDAGGGAAARRDVVVPAPLDRVATIGAGHVEQVVGASGAGVTDVDPAEVDVPLARAGDLQLAGESARPD